MRNLSVLTKILLPVLGVAAILTVRRISQDSVPRMPDTSERIAQAEHKADSIPLCSGDAFPGQMPTQNGPKRHSVTLSWNPGVAVSNSPGNAIKGYYVYRSPKPQSYADTNRLNSLPLSGTRCLDTAVEPRATYYYVVKTVTVNGAQSIASKEVKAVIPFP